MNAVVIIAVNTFREIIRDRILYGIVVFALLLVGLSLALGNVSFSEQSRISADFGINGIQIAGAILAIFVGSTLVSREIDKQTILTLLARPISRTQFLMGKFLGLNLVIATVMAGLALVLAGVIYYLDFKIQDTFAQALLGIYLECLILVSVTMLLGTFCRPITAVIYSVAIFIMGHWEGTLDGLIRKSDTDSYRQYVHLLDYLVPNLERFNWRDGMIYLTSVPTADIVASVGYAFGWIFVLMGLTSYIFRRRDFV